MRSKAIIVYGVIASAALTALPASACSGRKPPPQLRAEGDRAYGLRLATLEGRVDASLQAQHWDRSTVVVLARTVRTMSVPIKGRQTIGALMRPVSVLKGPQMVEDFVVASTVSAPCNRNGALEAAIGNAGETFVIYLSAKRPSPEKVVAVDRPTWIIDPRIKTAPANRR